MNNVVLDASALLALLQQEPGQERVLAALEELNTLAMISAVNFSEVVTKLVRDGLAAAELLAVLAPFRRYVVDFTLAQAEQAGELYRTTKSAGLSLGDRACLALAADSNGVFLTADRVWTKLNTGVRVELIRD